MTRARTALLVILTACGAENRPPDAPATPPPAPSPAAAEAPDSAEPATEPAELDRRFEGVLLSAAAEYVKWGRVDERPNLAPVLCRAPIYPGDYGTPAHARLSKVDDESPHGRKLYYLFAADRPVYLRLAERSAPVPVGTTIVKQSWTTRPGKPATAEPGDPLALASTAAPAPVSWIETDAGALQTDEQADLFIITKLSPDVPGTDDGWIYGTVTPDGRTVTSAGLVSRCMGCHEDAPYERLFGLQKTKQLRGPATPPTGLRPVPNAAP